LAIIFIGVALFSYFTNPFTHYSLVVDPFTAHEVSGQIVLEETHDIRLRRGMLYRGLERIKRGYAIVSNNYFGSKKAPRGDVDDIIKEIVDLRFNANHPYLISGDHFSMLYLRSLGIFFHSAIDPRTAFTPYDWFQRQALYLKTVAFALNSFAGVNQLTTTVTPVGRYSVALVNVFQPPSDSLYSLLYALQVLQQSNEITQRYRFQTANGDEYPLQTTTTARQLLQVHQAELARYWQSYSQQVFDPSTGLIRRNLELSSVKDGTKRSSAFYDNVVYWKTWQYAQEFGLAASDPAGLQTLRQRILQNYWLDGPGYFREDADTHINQRDEYSSDWLIAYMTGFLDPHNPVDRRYLERCIAYIQQEKLDQPFGLLYQSEQRRDRLYDFVRIFTPDYGTTTIWSNWGMEYIKLLTALYQNTCQPNYLATAQDQIESYSQNIVKYRGYPEVYDRYGAMYVRPFYKSVRQTGWVVSFLQARGMVDWTEKQSCQKVAGK
jgi:hypothetical protein